MKTILLYAALCVSATAAAAQDSANLRTFLFIGTSNSAA